MTFVIDDDDAGFSTDNFYLLLDGNAGCGRIHDNVLTYLVDSRVLHLYAAFIDYKLKLKYENNGIPDPMKFSYTIENDKVGVAVHGLKYLLPLMKTIPYFHADFDTRLENAIEYVKKYGI